MFDSNRIKTGDIAPGFALRDQHGEEIRLSRLLEQGPVVLYFYPKDETPGCRAEACSFRDHYEDFVKAGATVVGISSDSVESHRTFSLRHQLPFHLVSDTDGRIRERYGVPKTLGLIPGRVTYVIDPTGVVRHIFSSQLRTRTHVEEALKTIQQVTP